jgi:hypothetical protein
MTVTIAHIPSPHKKRRRNRCPVVQLHAPVTAEQERQAVMAGAALYIAAYGPAGRNVLSPGDLAVAQSYGSKYRTAMLGEVFLWQRFTWYLQHKYGMARIKPRTAVRDGIAVPAAKMRLLHELKQSAPAAPPAAKPCTCSECGVAIDHANLPTGVVSFNVRRALGSSGNGPKAA